MHYLIAAFAAALVLTLALASFLTPAIWWRRPNVKALAVLALGTWGIGSLLLALAPERAMAQPPAVTAGLAPLTVRGAVANTIAAASVPAHTSFRVFDDLNLRAAPDTGARRLALVPAGAQLTTTGARAGDWWQVRWQRGRQAPVDGWVSSLWLRRADEAHARSGR